MIRTKIAVAPVVVIALIATLSRAAQAADSQTKARALPQPARALEITGIDGNVLRPLEVRKAKASVIIFVLQDCPISNKYAPEIQRLADEFEKKGARVFLVHVDPELSDRDAAKHAQEHQYKLPVLVDRKHALVGALNAKIAPEAFVIDGDGKVQYRGRIDDRYVALGKPRHEVQRRDLRLAVEAVIDGGTVEVHETEAVGCFIPELD
jgi:peroxiredoxin